MRLVIIRHGETVGNSSVRYYGRTDVALSGLGRHQMIAASRWLRSNRGERHLEPVFSSPMARAIESARLVGGPASRLITIPEFVEVDFGLFEGLTAQEIRERYPEEFRRWDVDPLSDDFVYPAGESRAAFGERVGRGARRMIALWHAARAQGGLNEVTALLVAHKGVIRGVMRELVGGIKAEIALGSIHILEEDEEPVVGRPRRPRWRAVELDVVSHLDGTGDK